MTTSITEGQATGINIMKKIRLMICCLFLLIAAGALGPRLFPSFGGKPETVLTADLVPGSKKMEDMQQNTKRLQQLIDTVSSAGGGTVKIPAGTYYFYSAGTLPRCDYAIICRDQVHVMGEGPDQTILKPFGEYTHGINLFYWDTVHYSQEPPFVTEPFAYLRNADFSGFTICCDETAYTHPKTSDYNAMGKGFMLAPIKDCDWNNVCVEYADGTGFGVDLPVNCRMVNCTARNCGKAATVQDIGASGFGIGIGLSQDESMWLENCQSYGNRKYGFFVENQTRFYEPEESRIGVSQIQGVFIQNCVAGGNLHDFGGARANDVTFTNCISTGEASNEKESCPIFVEEHSRRIRFENMNLSLHFDDIANLPQDHQEAVIWACSRGIIPVYDRTSFAPEQPVTRGFAVMSLYSCAGYPGNLPLGWKLKGLTESFEDVDRKHPAYDAALWLKASGSSFRGLQENHFFPDEICREKDLTDILFRYAGKDGAELSAGVGDSVLTREELAWLLYTYRRENQKRLLTKQKDGKEMTTKWGKIR